MKLWKKLPAPWRYILSLFFFSRLGLTLLGVVSRTWLSSVSNYVSDWIYSDHLWLDIWGIWDTGWYLEIARRGYLPGYSLAPFASMAFFPFYPLLISGLGKLIGDYYVASLLISNLCLIGAAGVLYRYVEDNFSKPVAIRTVKFLFVFPTAFIFSGGFTESLFLLLVVGTFYFADQKKYLAASLSGFLAATTKLMGVFLVIPILLSYLESIKDRAQVKDIFLLGLTPLGTVAYWLYTSGVSGDWRTILKVEQQGWEHRWNNPFWSLFKSFFHSNWGIKLAGLLSSLSLALVWLRRKKMRGSWIVFSLIYIFVPLLTTPSGVFGFLSMPRYLLVVFPLYVLLAQLGQDKKINWALTVVMVLLQGVLMIFWTNGYKVVV